MDLFGELPVNLNVDVDSGLYFLLIRALMRTSVCVRPETLLTRYVAEYLTHFHQNYINEALRDRDERNLGSAGQSSRSRWFNICWNHHCTGGDIPCACRLLWCQITRREARRLAQGARLCLSVTPSVCLCLYMCLSARATYQVSVQGLGCKAI